MEVFILTRTFPREEQYSLTDQIRKSARSVGANIVEGWSKRSYEAVFKKHLVDSMGSCDETKYWLDISRHCGYISQAVHQEMSLKYEEVSKMLMGLFKTLK